MKHVYVFVATRKIGSELFWPAADGETSCGLDGFLWKLRPISGKEVRPIGRLSPPAQPDERWRWRLVNGP